MINRSAFTSVELCAAVAATGLLALISTPAARSAAAHKAVCLNNHRQLIQAWQLFADDNSGRFVGNYHGGDAAGGAIASKPSAAPWTVGWLDWGTSPDNTNRNFLFNARYSRFAPYLATRENVYKCPSDTYLGPAQVDRGWKERVRSYSMNLTIGNENFKANSGPLGSNYRIALKMSDLIYPSPAETMVTLEEHPDSINDPGFFPPSTATAWVDLPASFHANSANFSFADGHVESHSWVASARYSIVRLSTPLPRPFPDDLDLLWVATHSSRRTERAF